MNCFIKTSIAAVFILIFAQLPVCAQSDIDTNRMNRDINIMENVLEELFKTSWAARGNAVHVGSGSFSFGRSNDIQGTYLEDYGIIFTIQGGPPAFLMISDSDGEESSYSFRYGDSEEGEPVTQESITSKIVEFLQDYGSTIGQLSDDDKVMVIYKSNTPNRSVTIFHSRSDENEKAKRQQPPTISVVATKQNLQAYRSGDINSGEFLNRLDISTTEVGEVKQKDLRVMAGIFETAFEEADEKSFRISGSVDYLHLDNFGALFSFNAQYSDRGSWAFSKVAVRLEAVSEELEARANLENRTRSKVDSARSEKQKEVEQSREEQKQETLDAYDQFLNDLKEYIVDYGRTLNSVSSNQRILVSVNLSSRFDEIPENIDLQIQKSVLESMDQGSMNRNQAMEQIQVREY